MKHQVLLVLVLAYNACAQHSNHTAGEGDLLLDGTKDFPWINLITDSVPDLSVYHSTSAIEAAVQHLPSSCKNAEMKVDSKGQLQVVSLTGTDQPPAGKAKNKVFYVFGIHGREYISSETAIKFLRALCDGSDRSKKLLAASDFRIIPVANPAGRRKVESGAPCVEQRKNGNNVDLNRNFDIKWEQGSSISEAEDFHGQGAFSEPESQIIRDVAMSFKPNLFVDIHSGDRTMMMPYSYKTQPAGNEPEQAAVLSSVNSAAFSGNAVRSGVASTTLDPPYTAAGTTIDYMHEQMKINFTYTYEIFSGVRTFSNIMTSVGEGFSIPKDAIIPLSVYRNMNSSVPQAALLETEPSLLVDNSHGKLAKADIVSFLSEPPKPVDMSLTMNLMDCFAYFNPTSKDMVEATASQWTGALFSTAEFFLKA